MIDWQEPPPFLQYMEEAEKIGGMGYTAGICAGMGIITIDQPAMLEIADDFERRAILAKTDGPMLEAAFKAGDDRARANIETMLNVGEEASPGHERRVDQAVEYLGDACGDLVIDYPAVFQLSE